MSVIFFPVAALPAALAAALAAALVRALAPTLAEPLLELQAASVAATTATTAAKVNRVVFTIAPRLPDPTTSAVADRAVRQRCRPAYSGPLRRSIPNSILANQIAPPLDSS